MEVGKLDILDLLESARPECKPLLLRRTPEKAQIGLIPDVNNKAICHVRVLDVLECLIQECIPTFPIIIIARVLKVLRLTTISSPKGREEVDELSPVLSGCLVITQD